MSKSSEIKTAYNAQAQSFTDFYAHSFSWKYLEKPEFDAAFLPYVNLSQRVLDLGCGDGRSISYLLQNGALEQHITGVDISDKLLALARERYPQANFVEGDLSEVSFSISSFDSVISCMVLHHLDNEALQNVFANVAEWLAHNGVFFFVMVHPFRHVVVNPAEYLERGWHDEKTPWGDAMPTYYRTVGDVLNALIAAGLVIEYVGEPSIPKLAQQSDPEEYARYRSYGAPRLAVRVSKS